MRITSSMLAQHEAEARALGRSGDLEGQSFEAKLAAAEESVRRDGIPPSELRRTLQFYSAEIAVEMIVFATANRQQRKPATQHISGQRYVVTGCGQVIRI